MVSGFIRFLYLAGGRPVESIIDETDPC